ncbi:nudC domain-containing protein 2 isoform X3 [Octopus bimaculoides]|uniref:nudC domain-containing protein 2 isoform X3 n=1 Tax=Octopus bimaculoides TaxID=37653 RepID=UPI00071E469C|nr:nudC domain-containing protein 2 isoform X3 [Octopus bimaculoides]|eukprot:XP_014768251.1 PREDICTED: nudC domain-containing protein 2-like isoform X2 [Octopus bimaculoides]
MAHFEEKSGIVPVKTPWGAWWQTVDEVFVLVNVQPGTSGRDIKCTIQPRHLKLVVKGETVIDGQLADVVRADDCLWTLEDKCKVDLCLLKSFCGAEKCWKSLLEGQYQADPYTFDQMEKKLTLQRFQYENPGFDFSGAAMTGNYQGGGPKFNTIYHFCILNIKAVDDMVVS